MDWRKGTMVLLENVIDNPHYLFLLSILIYVIPRAINYWNTTQFEKKFMNDLQRIKKKFLETNRNCYIYNDNLICKNIIRSREKTRNIFSGI